MDKEDISNTSQETMPTIALMSFIYYLYEDLFLLEYEAQHTRELRCCLSTSNFSLQNNNFFCHFGAYKNCDKCHQCYTFVSTNPTIQQPKA